MVLRLVGIVALEGRLAGQRQPPQLLKSALLRLGNASATSCSSISERAIARSSSRSRVTSGTRTERLGRRFERLFRDEPRQRFAHRHRAGLQRLRQFDDTQDLAGVEHAVDQRAPQFGIDTFMQGFAADGCEGHCVRPGLPSFEAPEPRWSIGMKISWCSTAVLRSPSRHADFSTCHPRKCQYSLIKHQ